MRDAIFGASGLASTLSAGTMIVDQTTGDPTLTRSMAADLAARQIDLIDAPVSGGVAGAQAGTIAIMVGASPAQYARVQPLLAAISPNVFHAGHVGNGQVIKLVNNMLSGAQRLLTFEAMTLAAKNGVAPETACDILLASGGRNAFMEKFLKPRVLKGDITAGFTLGLMHKDVALACDLGAASGVPTLFGDVARDLYAACVAENGVDGEVNTCGTVLDRRAGTAVVPRSK